METIILSNRTCEVLNQIAKATNFKGTLQDLVNDSYEVIHDSFMNLSDEEIKQFCNQMGVAFKMNQNRSN